jgi:hypothetical protein
MKTAIFAAALLVGGAAIAQTTTTTTTTTTATPATAGTVAPGNSAPERDARGIPVVSDPAEVPAGANQAQPIPSGAVFTPNPNQAQVFTPRPATEDYPACSRTVTDNCVQSYERGRSPQ